MRILILGGYGVFGGRLAELLAGLSALELLICGRSLARAEAFCARYRGAARVRPVRLDRRDIAGALRLERPDLVVDASGPFQDYGAERYGVVAAAIAAGIDYLDLADAADFVFGISRFDEEARAAGIFVLSGVSTFPVLTAAVLAEMAQTMEVVSARGGIAPSPYAGIGLNVMRAVLGYAGSPVKLLRGGKPAYGIGLAESMNFTVAVPGRLPLNSIRFSLVDVPDLQVTPPLHPAMIDIWMGAGPTPEVLHRALNLLAAMRARFGLPPLSPFSRLFHAVLNRMRFGEHRGGMFVSAGGRVGGRTVERSWHLIAEGDDGPYIPSMAAEGIVRKLLAGERPANGARSGAGALSLRDYEALFRRRAIFTGFRGEVAGLPLYRQVLGAAFDELPARLRELHASDREREWTGHAEVRRGGGILARAIGALLGLPPSAARVPVTVTFSPVGEVERWTRDFGGKRFSSVQSCGTGRAEHLLVERFGAVAIGLALVVDGSRLRFVPRRWTFAGLPLPAALLPAGASFESEEGGRFHFDVEIALPLIGLVVAYKGWLLPRPAVVSASGALAPG
jgi:hypothetical protein